MCKNKVMTTKEATCKQIYWSEIDKILERPTYYFEWEADYYYASFDWELISMIPYECTVENILAQSSVQDSSQVYSMQL